MRIGKKVGIEAQMTNLRRIKAGIFSAAFRHRAVRLEWRVTRVDRRHGVHRQAGALHRAVVVDPSLALPGGPVAWCRAILGEVVAAPREPLCGVLPQHPLACSVPPTRHLNTPRESKMRISMLFIARETAQGGLSHLS